MAKFRQNYAKSGTAAATLVRVSLLAGILLTMIYLFYFFGTRTLPIKPSPKPELPVFLPASSTGIVLGKDRYWISWDSTMQLAEWVTYLSSRGDSADWLLPKYEDNSSATTFRQNRDYVGMVNAPLLPLQTITSDPESLKNSLYRCGLFPQNIDFHNNVSKFINYYIKLWSKASDTLLAVAGPVANLNKIRENGVPQAYFYVLLSSSSDSETKTLGFLFPHEPLPANADLWKFAVSVDAVEKVTGLDFFPKYLDDTAEAALEMDFNLNLWLKK